MVNGKCLATFSKEEIIIELGNRKVDRVQVCLTGRIEPEAEYLCKILHFCMEVDAVDSDKGDLQLRARRSKKRKVEDVMVRSTLLIQMVAEKVGVA